MNEPKLDELQEELIEAEKIPLAIYAGLAAFSLTCLLRLITLPTDSFLVVFSSCMFTISAIIFLIIVLSKYNVLHKVKDIHIGHVILSENFALHPQTIGASCLLLGFLAMLFYISIFTFFVGLMTIIWAKNHHSKFNTEMNKMMGAREAVNQNKNA